MDACSLEPWAGNAPQPRRAASFVYSLLPSQLPDLLRGCKMDPEEQELLNDYRYRSYSSVIEKALRNFESSSEWADLISSLGKLNKVRGAGSVWVARRQGHPCPFIPSRTCPLNVTLPADYSP